MRVTEDEEEGQTLVHGLGALHLEIVEGRLRDEWGVRCQFGKRRVSYRETLNQLVGAEPIRVKNQWEKEIAGKRYSAEVELEVRPLNETEIVLQDSLHTSPTTSEDSALESGGASSPHSAWAGNVVVDAQQCDMPHPSELPADSSLMPLVSGLASALSTSPHTSLPISRAHVTVLNVVADEGAPAACFTGAASTALRRVITQLGRGQVMEPYVRLKVTVSADHIGRVAGDLTEHGGEIVDLDASGDVGVNYNAIKHFEAEVYSPPSWVTPSGAGSVSSSKESQPNRSISAVAPLSRMLDYSTRLRAVSGGLGVFEMSLEGFRVVPELRMREILHEIGR